MSKYPIIFIAKLTSGLSRITRHGGTALPGLVAEKLNSNILSELAGNNFKQGIILITGTNGKTTTALLTTQILHDAGHTVLHNKGGSNLMRGIITTIIKSCNWRGQLPHEIAVFEVDENAFPAISAKLNPSHIVITNLFRDQLDRYGELDSTAEKLRQAIMKSKNAQIHLNADDPLVASLSTKKRKPKFFGVQDYQSTTLDDERSADSIVSPVSAVPLIYSRRYYSHIGVYKSENGDFIRPKPELEATNIRVTEQSIRFQTTNSKTWFQAPIGGFYNIYNILAAMSLALSIEVNEKQLKNSLAQAKPAFGRTEQINYLGTNLTMLLAKNPVGFNQVIENYVLPNSHDPLMIIINDNIADGRDVSWLWDVSFEALKTHKAPIILCGQRNKDMALRLKYANVDNFTMINDFQEGLSALNKAAKSTKRAAIIPTYTAMLAIRKILVKKTDISEYWQ